MAKLIVVLGFAGSGKTTLLEEIGTILRGRCKSAEEYEKVRPWDEGIPLPPREPERWSRLSANLSAGWPQVLAGIEFVSAGAEREGLAAWVVATVPEARLEWWCFERDVEKANANCRARTNKPDDPTGEGHVRINNDFLLPRYDIPAGAVVLKIYEPGQPFRTAGGLPFDLVEMLGLPTRP